MHNYTSHKLYIFQQHSVHSYQTVVRLCIIGNETPPWLIYTCRQPTLQPPTPQPTLLLIPPPPLPPPYPKEKVNTTPSHSSTPPSPTKKIPPHEHKPIISKPWKRLSPTLPPSLPSLQTTTPTPKKSKKRFPRTTGICSGISLTGRDLWIMGFRRGMRMGNGGWISFFGAGYVHWTFGGDNLASDLTKPTPPPRPLHPENPGMKKMTTKS